MAYGDENGQGHACRYESASAIATAAAATALFAVTHPPTVPRPVLLQIMIAPPKLGKFQSLLLDMEDVTTLAPHVASDTDADPDKDASESRRAMSCVVCDIDTSSDSGNDEVGGFLLHGKGRDWSREGKVKISSFEHRFV